MDTILDKLDRYYKSLNLKVTGSRFYEKYLQPVCKLAYDLAKERELNEDAIVMATFFSKLNSIKGRPIYYDKETIAKEVDKIAPGNKELVIKILNNFYNKEEQMPELTCIYDAKFIINFQDFSKICFNIVNKKEIPHTAKTKFSALRSVYKKSSKYIKEKYHSQMSTLFHYFKTSVVTMQDSIKVKNFKVVVKCGHVGKNRYYPGVFVVKALTASEAASKARNLPRVKHEAKHAILDVKEIDYKEVERIFKKREKEIYFHINNAKQRKILNPLIQRLVVKEEKPHYKNQEKKYSDKNDKKGNVIKNLKKYTKYNKEDIDISDEIENV